MSQNYISIKGARVHNLKNIDVKIPRDKFVVKYDSKLRRFSENTMWSLRFHSEICISMAVSA